MFLKMTLNIKVLAKSEQMMILEEKKSKIKSPLIWEEDFCVPVCDYSAEGEMTPSLPGLRRS